MNRNLWLGLGIAGALALVLIVSIVSTRNTAVVMEEGIQTSRADIQVQEKRRLDLITKLVQVVEQSTQYEQSTLVLVTQMREAADSGNVESAQMAIHAIAEAYPDLKANANFTQLMTELSMTENMIAEARKTYNSGIQRYRRFIRQFPASLLLGISGYETQNYAYLEFQDTDLPSELFRDSK